MEVRSVGGGGGRDKGDTRKVKIVSLLLEHSHCYNMHVFKGSSQRGNMNRRPQNVKQYIVEVQLFQ